MKTKYEIIRLALKILKADATLENIEIMNEFYDSAISMTLKSKNWDFANTDKELTLTGLLPVNPKFLYEYELPKDYIRAISLYSVNSCENIDFKICVNSADKLTICANATPVVLNYTKRIENENEFSASFVSSLANCLAYLAAYAITRNINNVTECIDIFETSLLERFD